MGEDRNSKNLFTLLQIADSAFPTGAFAHSLGLETYIHRREVFNAESAEELLSSVIRRSVLTCDGPIWLLSFRLDGGLPGWEDRLQRLDDLAGAVKPVREFREAGMKVGLRFLQTASDLFSLTLGRMYQQGIRKEIYKGYLPVAHGLVCRDLGIDEETGLTAYLYGFCSAWVAVAVRLIPLSQTDGQRILNRQSEHIPSWIDRVKACPLEEIRSFTPHLDVSGMVHEYSLPSRLCMS